MSILRYVNLRSSVFIKAAVMFMAAGILFTTAHNAGAAGKTRIVVVPFTVNAVDNLDFLKRGISEMLVSRLGWEDKVVAISAGKPGDAIGPLAKQNRADYVVTGSLTVLGTRVSTDSRVFKGTDVTTPVLSYGRTGGQQSDIIDHIDGLAGEINGRLLGRGKPLEKKTETTAPVVPVPVPPCLCGSCDPPVGQSASENSAVVPEIAICSVAANTTKMMSGVPRSIKRYRFIGSLPCR